MNMNNKKDAKTAYRPYGYAIGKNLGFIARIFCRGIHLLGHFAHLHRILELVPFLRSLRPTCARDEQASHHHGRPILDFQLDPQHYLQHLRLQRESGPGEEEEGEAGDHRRGTGGLICL